MKSLTPTYHKSSAPSSFVLAAFYDHCRDHGRSGDTRRTTGIHDYFTSATAFTLGTLVGTRVNDVWTVRHTRAKRLEVEYGAEQTMQIEDPRESAIGFGLTVARKYRPVLSETVVELMDPKAEADAAALEARLNAAELRNARFLTGQAFPALAPIAERLGTVRELRRLYVQGKRKGMAVAA